MLAGLCVQSLPGAGLDRGPRIRAVRARADAFVSAARQTRNFGSARDLRIGASPVTRAYVLFVVNVRSGDVRHVTLLLYSRTRSRAGFQVHLVQDAWGERTITFQNAPVVSAAYVASGPLQAHYWKAVDVTSLVGNSRGRDDVISFALTSASAKGADFASRETGLHGPRLVVERQATTSTSTSTSTNESGLTKTP